MNGHDFGHERTLTRTHDFLDLGHGLGHGQSHEFGHGPGMSGNHGLGQAGPLISRFALPFRRILKF